MKKYLIALLVLGFLISCVHYSSQFVPKSVIEKIDESTVAIAVYYYMDYNEWERRMLRKDALMVDIKVDAPMKCIAYIGAGTLIRNNHIITVAHLFNHDQNTYRSEIWIAIKDYDHFIKADLIAIADNSSDFSNDCAVIKLRENIKRPGLTIAKKPALMGEKVIYSGSVGGAAFFHRFGFRTEFKWFFKKDNDGGLHLSYWHDDAFICVFPGGNGDSGGSIKNTRGEIVGIMYLGIENHLECYVFSNPLSRLWEFLRQHNLEHLG